MRQSKLLLSIALTGSLLYAASCRKDDLSIKTSDVEVALTNPAGLQNVKTSNLELTFKEVNSGEVTTLNVNSTAELSAITLPEGAYDVSLEGDIEYEDEGSLRTGKVRGFQQGLVVRGGSVDIDIPLFLYNADAKFVLKEIFFTGTLSPEGKSSNGDKYFIIYNNSEDTLYADGLIFSESAFLTTTRRDYGPDIMSEAFTAGNVVIIPGTGTEYPVLPGKQIVVATDAIDHREINPNSFDLRDADFELTLTSGHDVDNPQVRDLVNIDGYMILHNRGYRSYTLARMPEGMTVEEFKAQNFYQYRYLASTGDSSKPQDAYKIPNSWIMDAVNLSVASEYEWIITDPSLDMGWTYCGKVASDETRYGKSVRRKVLSTNPDGRVILKDNNNSTLDFEAEVRPSLMP